MKTKILLLFIVSLPCFTFSQTLSQKSKEVKTAWEALQKQPTSKEVQSAYLKGFPANKQDFMTVFQPADFKQLYHDCNKYIKSFAGLAKQYPAEVIDKSINIGKDLVWEADATGAIQQAIVEMGVNNTAVFSKKLNSLSITQKAHLIKFMADEEGIKHDHKYQELINSLTKIGEISLVNKFIDARTQREKVKE